jgi:hypothetical protein
MGRNWNRKNSENTQDKGWKRKERFQAYLKRNAVAVKRKIVIKPVTEISPNKKNISKPSEEIQQSFSGKRTTTTTQKPKLGSAGALLRVANKVPPTREQSSPYLRTEIPY